MNDFIKKLVEIEKSTSKEKGDFKLFAVFARTDHFGKWDIVISADWIKDELEGLELISKKLTKTLSVDELLSIARIVNLDVSDKFVHLANHLFKVKNHNCITIENTEINGLLISRGFIIASQNEKSTAVSAR